MISDSMVSQTLPQAPNLVHPIPRRRPRRIFALGLAAVMLFTFGCATSPNPIPSAWSASNAMIEIDTGGRGLLFVKPNHQLGRYDNLLIEHVGFRYGHNRGWLSPREEDRISAMLTSVIHGQRDGDLGVVTEPGPCALSVSLFLNDLEIFEEPRAVGSSTSIVTSFGEATLIMELRDSLEDEPLARFLQRRELGGGIGSGGSHASLRRLGTVVAITMRDMGRQLREITPAALGAIQERRECEGRLTQVALGSH
jgi:hypothetical protein